MPENDGMARRMSSADMAKRSAVRRTTYENYRTAMNKSYEDQDSLMKGPAPTLPQAMEDYMVGMGGPYARGSVSPLGGKAKE
jgi:hypothetical protein